MSVPIWVWVATLAAIVVMLVADMLAHRAARGSTTALALRWSVVWVGLGVGFGAIVWAAWGSEHAGEYFAGYLLEKSLSVDNVLLFALIFASFAVPRAYQHRVLFLGVLGALALRALLIAAGAALLSRFAWVTYIFGAFLLVTALRMVRSHGGQSAERGGSLIRRVIPTTDGYHGEQFWVRQAGRLTATPLLIVLVLIEISDVIFAVDSIPAVFSVTREPFLVFTANAFAILGLRSLYFLLDGLLSRLVYLRTGLAVILCFVGLKMLLEGVIHIPVAVSLGVIVVCLTVTTWASLRAARRRKVPGPSTVDRLSADGDRHVRQQRAPGGAVTNSATAIETVAASPPAERRGSATPTSATLASSRSASASSQTAGR